MAKDWLWYGRPKDLLGYTSERGEAHKNQFVKVVSEMLQKDFPGIKFKQQKEYYRKPWVCDLTDCFDKESYDFLKNDMDISMSFVEILPVFSGNNQTYFLELDKSEFNPDDLSHYQDKNGNYVQVFPDVTLYQWKITKDFYIQFTKDENDYVKNNTIEQNSKNLEIYKMGFETVKKGIVKVKSPEISIYNTVKKNFTIFNALLETYKEPFTQWKNEQIKQLKVEEVLRKKMLILAEK